MSHQCCRCVPKLKRRVDSLMVSLAEAMSDPDEARTALRHNAHDTEKAAAFAALPRSGTARRECLMVIARNGRYGATDDEIARATGMIPPRVASRRRELVLGKWVKDSGDRRITRNGVEAIVWILTKSARIRWKSR